jgi:hypothetical protein
MPTVNPSYVAGEAIEASRILKQDPSYDHQCLKATLGSTPIGVSHEGTDDAPIPGASAYAAHLGYSCKVYGPTETCEIAVGSLAIAAGDHVAPDANSKAQPAVHGFPYVGKALAAGAASAKVRVQVEIGVENKTGTTLVKTQADTPYTVLLKDLGKTLLNTGASGQVTFALPAALPGYEIRARVDAAQELRLDANGTEVICLPSSGAPQAAGKYIWADAVGEFVHLRCTEAGQWDVVSYIGTWTVES